MKTTDYSESAEERLGLALCASLLPLAAGEFVEPWEA